MSDIAVPVSETAPTHGQRTHVHDRRTAHTHTHGRGTKGWRLPDAGPQGDAAPKGTRAHPGVTINQL